MDWRQVADASKSPIHPGENRFLRAAKDTYPGVAAGLARVQIPAKKPISSTHPNIHSNNCDISILVKDRDYVTDFVPTPYDEQMMNVLCVAIPHKIKMFNVQAAKKPHD